MRQFIIILSICNILLCDNKIDNSNQNELNLNKSKWENSNITNYQLTYFESCECGNYGLFTVVVKSRIIDSVFHDTSRVYIKTTNNYANYPTVDTLFNKIQRAINDKIAEIDKVKYNHDFGYPDTILINWDSYITDASEYIVMRKFTVLNSF